MHVHGKEFISPRPSYRQTLVTESEKRLHFKCSVSCVHETQADIRLPVCHRRGHTGGAGGCGGGCVPLKDLADHRLDPRQPRLDLLPLPLVLLSDRLQ